MGLLRFASLIFVVRILEDFYFTIMCLIPFVAYRNKIIYKRATRRIGLGYVRLEWEFSMTHALLGWRKHELLARSCIERVTYHM